MSEKTHPRLHVTADLGGGVVLEGPQAHYVANVMRRRAGDDLLLFNGRDGEWRYRVAGVSRRAVEAEAAERTREQAEPGDVELLFAPLKKARTDYLAQKATELGASRLSPVMTRRTVAERVKTERLAANAVEAAEQCGLLWVPEIAEPRALDTVLAEWPEGRALVFCDESHAPESPVERLGLVGRRPVSVLIGPEGGFAPEEAEAIRRLPGAHAISLGPRIMRADTAAVAALTLVQAICGDW